MRSGTDIFARVCKFIIQLHIELIPKGHLLNRSEMPFIISYNSLVKRNSISREKIVSSFQPDRLNFPGNKSQKFFEFLAEYFDLIRIFLFEVFIKQI